MTPTPSGQGYYLLAADGGVFVFGDATFHGSAVGAVGRAVALKLGNDSYTVIGADGRTATYNGAPELAPLPVRVSNGVGAAIS